MQWNIGGGKIREKGDSAHNSSSYRIDGLQAIIAVLKNINPDIVTLQEAHSNSNQNQIAVIAQALGLPYFVSDTYAESHITVGRQLGQGIMSRFPIRNHCFQLFHNPNYETVWEDGRRATSHDKGVTSCVVDYGGIHLAIKTMHLIPFKRFKVDPLSETAAHVIADVQTKLESNNEHLLVQGDFNLNLTCLRDTLPEFIDEKTQEIPQQTPTRANGRRLDHVVYRGLKLLETRTVVDVLTDHFPITSMFELQHDGKSQA